MSLPPTRAVDRGPVGRADGPSRARRARHDDPRRDRRRRAAPPSSSLVPNVRVHILPPPGCSRRPAAARPGAAGRAPSHGALVAPLRAAEFVVYRSGFRPTTYWCCQAASAASASRRRQ